MGAHGFKRRGSLSAALLSVVALAAGCGSAGTNRKAAAASDLAATGSANASDMPGMQMGVSDDAVTKVPSVNGIKPVASQILATAHWQGMQIQARTTTPTEFVIYAGSGKERLVKPTRRTSFHLMVTLSDSHTGVAIPYAGVWATITREGKVVYDAQQQPMLSAYMGPHYGDNVTLPGPGHYELTLLISPPVAGRHLEYRHVWLKPRRVRVAFNWKPTR
ncbi:MAG TPA: iron transporter [Solirubrobacteraceae bacterium]